MNRVRIAAWLSLALAVYLPAQTQNRNSGPWVMERSGTTSAGKLAGGSTTAAGLRGVHAVSAEVAWASGTGGTIVRTLDGGATWQRCATPPGAARLDFRAVWAWDAKTAIAMSSGPGSLSRLYKTTDGCASWKLLFTNPDKDGFWDAMVFTDPENGMILGDPTPVDSNRPGATAQLAMTILTTSDGGRSWTSESGGVMNSAMFVPNGTGAFAASNSALFLEGHEGWFGVGGKGGARVFIGDQYSRFPGPCDCAMPHMPHKRVWFTRTVPVPMAGGTDSSGVFSLDGRGRSSPGRPSTLVAVGGDYMKPNDSAGTAAWSADGGKTWHAAAKPPHGYRSAVAWDAGLKAWITVGTNGSDISDDDGKTWLPLDNGNWNALSLPWVVGPDGRIAKLDAARVQEQGLSHPLPDTAPKNLP